MEPPVLVAKQSVGWPMCVNAHNVVRDAILTLFGCCLFIRIPRWLHPRRRSKPAFRPVRRERECTALEEGDGGAMADGNGGWWEDGNGGMGDGK